MEAKAIKLEYYVSEGGKTPYTDWFLKLRDQKAKALIAIRLDRLQEGNWGDKRALGDGVIELKIDYGPGYRVYCLQDGNTIVVLLCGGTKKQQQKDIEKAKKYAQDYRSE